jgi:hypothetical protein
MHKKPDIRGYRDYAAWERDWRGFIVNERPVIQRVAEPSPLLILKPDHGLIALFRAHHQMPNPAEGGDVIVESRLATHGPSRTAKALMQYRWTAPIAYTMTLIFDAPQCLDFLRPMLCNGGAWCGCAPRPDLGMIWIPRPDDLLEHLAITAAAFSMPFVGGLN